MKKLLALSLFVSACGGAMSPLEEGEASIESGPILTFLNGPQVNVDLLDVEVGLDTRAARSIAEHVLGRDGRWGSGDEDQLDSIAELDALPYVGAAALRLLDAYVRAHPMTDTVLIEGVQITRAQADAILHVANTATFHALDVDAQLDSRAARAIEAARPIADLAAFSAVPYVTRGLIEKLLAYLDLAPADPAFVSFTVTSERGTEIAIEWNAANVDSCHVTATTTFNRRRTHVYESAGLPARSSVGLAWLVAWGDTVDVGIMCQGAGNGLGEQRSVTRAALPPPPVGAIDCATLRGGTFDGVRFTASQECTAVHFINEARYSDMALMTDVGRRTAYDCTPDGRCARNEGRRSRWTSLAQFSGFAGIGQSSMQGLLAAIARWTPGSARTDTVADLWVRKRTLVDAPVSLDRVYVTGRSRDQSTSAFQQMCIEVRDAPGAPNYMTACIRYIGADSAAGCSGTPNACLDRAVGTWVSLRGSIAAAREAPGGYRIGLNTDGPIAADPVPPASSFSTGTGAFVDLEGARAEVLVVDPTFRARADAIPSEYPVFVAAYRVNPGDVGDRAIGAAFSHALDLTDWLTSNDVAVGTVALSSLGRTIADRLEQHSPGADPAARETFLELGPIMALGMTHGHSASQEDSGDYSYVSVVAVNHATGEIRILGFRRDP